MAKAGRPALEITEQVCKKAEKPTLEKKAPAKKMAAAKKKPAAKKPAAKRGRGRPKWVPSEKEIQQAQQLAAQGLTVEQVARSLGVGATAFFERQQEYPELMEAMLNGRAKGVATISNALFVKAKGGDNTAMIFYLKNRAPNEWKDRVEHTAPPTAPIRINITRAVRK